MELHLQHHFTVKLQPCVNSLVPRFQDVSDRIEKESPDSELVRRLERRGWEVTGGNWREKIDPFILDDLGKFRSYRASSIRDLLRALRNKVRDRNQGLKKRVMTPGTGSSSEEYLGFV